jgi:acyl carrier protein
MIDELTSMIVTTTRELSAEQGIEIAPTLNADTRLFGEGGLLDSMALVSLVIAVEQAVEEKYGTPVALADEKALSQRSSPYRTIGTLAAYAAQELAARRKPG